MDTKEPMSLVTVVSNYTQGYMDTKDERKKGTPGGIGYGKGRGNPTPNLSGTLHSSTFPLLPSASLYSYSSLDHLCYQPWLYSPTQLIP